MVCNFVWAEVLLAFITVIDVVAEACVLCRSFDVLGVLAGKFQTFTRTDVEDVFVVSGVRACITFALYMSARRYSRRWAEKKAQMQIQQKERKQELEKKEPDGGKGLVRNLSAMFFSFAATHLLVKCAFLLVFQDEITEKEDGEHWRWALVGAGGLACLLQYVLLLRSITSVFRRATAPCAMKKKVGKSSEICESLLNACGPSNGVIIRDTNGAEHQAGVAGIMGGRVFGEVIEREEEEEEEVVKGGLQDNMQQLGKKKGVIWRLFMLTTPDWHWMLAGLVFLCIAAATQAIVPKYTGEVINNIILDKSADKFVSSLLVLSLMSVITSASSGIRGACFIVSMSRMNVRVRRQAYASILCQEIAYFDQTKTGDLTSRLSADTVKMSESISLNLNVFFRSLVQAVGVLCLMFLLQWQLTVVTFMAVPLVAFVSKVYGNYYKRLTTDIQDAQAVANSAAEEVIASMRTVRSFACEAHEVDRYSGKLSEILKLNDKQAVAYLGYGAFVSLAPLLTTVTVLFFGGHLVLTGLLKPGDLVSFVFYQQSLSQAMNSMGDVFTGLMQAAGAAEKVFAIIDRKPAIEPAGNTQPEHLQGHIKFENVSFSYETREGRVLDGVTFEIKPGQIVALVGKSGSGKSSCISLLERFYEPSQGHITLDGRPLSEYDHSYLHRKVSLVGQEPVLYSRSIQDNITYGLDDADGADVEGAAKLSHAHDFICAMADGYDTPIGERGAQLSGGQKQRIAIARALARDPAVLVLDEATSALDTESEALVQQAIDHSMKGRTVLIVAHRLSTVRNADKIIVMQKGRVVEVGSHNELVRKQGVYSELVSRQLSDPAHRTETF